MYAKTMEGVVFLARVGTLLAKYVLYILIRNQSPIREEARTVGR